MCRNITTLRGLEPPATPDEIHAAATQYVRKVTGVTKTTDTTRNASDTAVAAITAATAQALADLPDRRNPPSTVPPLRRDDVAARVAARQAAREEHERLHEQGVPHDH
ncbi:DUF2277 family protein [Sanguibacter antarcticus]|uniref:DUF2277 family protein n=1 Tax=Sanguibacter antarcticus TaxID=372484 RepID=A0A2A9E4A2_9MICO|nr:DUF2277 family protein [Sanguibacter antarcticus]PFG33020.1 hypothetical protein ATL42_0872 [Sanguibacter antarcticus]